MRRQERRQKFNEAVIDFLYPPRPLKVEEDEDSKSSSRVEIKGGCCPDDSGDSNSLSKSESDGVDGSGDRKLTRAQRKRIRKKKLRAESIRRGKMIGPLLPSVDDNESADIQKDETKDSPPNAQVDNESCENQVASTKQGKLKHRRMVKRLAKDGLASSTQTEN
ncbi:hypothetical protein SAY87_009135 [Trapa incisa]|uniref:Uncharacterized protein n=1 Tax=Trapa incisa TaxID=236973 RepID=A0AAN7K186_9MYRT|nr:hypothetical protein SAY87_009135 [Trapa incisa]